MTLAAANITKPYDGTPLALTADWTPVTDANKPQMRFFKVTVEMK